MPGNTKFAWAAALLVLISACARNPPRHVSHAATVVPTVTYSAVLENGETRDVTSATVLPCQTRAIEVSVQLESSVGPDLFRRTRAAASDLELRAGGGLKARPGDGTRLVLDVDPLRGAFAGHELALSGRELGPKGLASSWQQDISCNRDITVSGKAGQGPQARGEDGPSLSAYVSKVHSASLGPVVFVVLEGAGKPLYWVAPLGVPIAIRAHGGDGGPGGHGGDGGTVAIEVDERFPELMPLVSWQAPGGRGNGGFNGRDGRGASISGDVLLTLIARSDLPAGLSLLDGRKPIRTPVGRMRSSPRPPPTKPVGAKSPAPKPTGAQPSDADLMIELPAPSRSEPKKPLPRRPRPASEFLLDARH